MSRLKPRPPMTSLIDLLNKQSNLPDGERVTQIEKDSPKGNDSGGRIGMIVAVKEILIPKFWPDLETIIQVPAIINWMRPINEFEYEAGITFRGSYPYNSDCSSIWKFKKIGDNLIPIKNLMNG